MTGAAVAISACWFLVAFVVRVAIHRLATGDTGIRGNAGPPFSAAWWARLTFSAAVVAVALAPVLVAAGWVGTPAGLRHDPVQWAGLVLAVAGIVATFWAQLEMGASWRIGVDPGERTELVTSGTFAVVRNPIFSTMIGTALGVVLMVPTVVGVAAFVVLVAAVEVQVRAVEEPYLRATHGPAFEAYEAAVGRFLPRVRRRATTA